MSRSDNNRRLRSFGVQEIVPTRSDIDGNEGGMSRRERGRDGERERGGGREKGEMGRGKEGEEARGRLTDRSVRVRTTLTKPIIRCCRTEFDNAGYVTGCSINYTFS